MDEFTSELIAGCTQDLSSEAKGGAKAALGTWLEKYVERVSVDAEKEGWEGEEVMVDERLYGPTPGVYVNGNAAGNGNGDAQGDEAVDGDGGWEAKRERGMTMVNPRFVLRQWVLEEIIAKLEESGVEDIVEGRKVLARILDVSPSSEYTQSRYLFALSIFPRIDRTSHIFIAGFQMSFPCG